ncbi:MAG: glycosyltransferase family 61 protein [Moorea sp. SIO4E2]|uniref:glycosyltransferase family 61 protein n=1 Tax=Moorena sp. SIO4E2 TaxID=2607826 RepID=UPI0013BD54DD|nr:glycosyltransferase family 61 protein [Moorena sp. SIO4E2]NEQ07443.1 glycosyltransferase family 61 protein [Moorena sp. SIO4E2]
MSIKFLIACMYSTIKSWLKKTYLIRQADICFDIAYWASAQNLPILEIHKPVLPEVKPHIYGDKKAKQEFQLHFDALSRPQILVPIEWATVCDSIGFVKLPDNKVCFQGNWHLPYLKKHIDNRQIFQKKRVLRGNFYSLLCLWGNEFYHWFHDVLPRLEFALPYLPPDTKFLLQEKPKAYQLDSLCAYGITHDRLELQPNKINTKVETLYFASPLGHTGLGSGSALKAVDQRMKRFFKIEVSNNFQRIYISRSQARTRRVVNERCLEPILRHHDFSICILEDLSWKDQIKLLSNSSAIIGPHGAGFTNMIYAPKGISVVEITTNLPIHYLIMARQLGHKFSRFKAILVSEKTLHPTDMHVDIKAFSKLLNSVVKN